MTSPRIFKHELALVESDAIGEQTRIWAWAHVMRGAQVGASCNVGEHCFIEGGAVIGDRCTIKNGVSVWDGVHVEDDVFIGPHAVLTNDIRPRSRSENFRAQSTRLREGCSIGANATVLCGLTIGRYAMVGAGSVVTRDVPDFGLVRGNPARLAGHVCVCGETLSFAEASTRCECGRSFVRIGDRVETESQMPKVSGSHSSPSSSGGAM